MKTYALFILLTLLTVPHSLAKIKNGYEREIKAAREAFKNLNAMLVSQPTMPAEQKNATNDNIARLRVFLMYHELTERLLLQFKLISPDMYNEIDSIKDKFNRPVDIYVKFLQGGNKRGSVAGSTNIPTGEDENAYDSRYGVHTASIGIVAARNALSLLAHEFGHIKYQVENTAEYRKFYAKYYQNIPLESEEIGHRHMDRSGLNASRFEKRFRLQYSDFLRIKTNRNENPLALIEQIRKNLN
ncbi:MAG: hypothetical protein WD824_04020 [Cyclobacteriaceae bacterium]